MADKIPVITIQRPGTGLGNVKKKISGHPAAKKITSAKDTAKIAVTGASTGVGLNSENTPLAEAPNGIGPENKAKPVERLANPLHKFNSNNATFTLAALTLDEVNFPDETIMKKPPKFIVAKSAGGSSRPTELIKGGRLEFYIDNVEINSLVHSNKETGHTQGTNITFSVHEPFSLGLFLQNIQLQCIQASGKDDVNYIGYPMALIVQFDKGTVTEPLTDFELGQLRKVIPIQLTKVNFGNSNGVSNYEVEALPLNDIAFSDQYGTLASDVEIKGQTVSEILFEGEQSLANYLNQKNVFEKPGFFAKLFNKDRKINSIRDYLFLFPDQRFKTSSRIKRTPTGSNRLSEDATNAEVKKDYETTVTKAFGNLFSDLKYDLNEGFSGDVLTMNQIGMSLMITEFIKNKRDAGKEFGDERSDVNVYYDKERKSYIRGSAKIDFNKKTIAFKKGTSIVKIIEDIILLSQYGQSIIKRKAQAENGLINWFKIVPARYIFNNDGLSRLYNKNPEVVVYRILQYGVPDDKFMAPDDVSRLDSLDYLVRKEYDILYTGKNKDVIEFNVEFNQAFYTAIQNDLGNNSPDNKDSATSSVKNKKKKSSIAISNNAYPTVNPPLDVEDPQNRDGGDAETLELRVARQFNEAILDSSVDLVKINLNIVGDPYYIPQSGLGNYIAPQYTVVGDQKELFLDGDGNANFLENIVLTKINFRTPIDIDASGKMAFTEQKAENELQLLGEFSGFYYPIRVVSSFSGNKFVQDVEMIRVKTGPNDGGRTQNKELLTGTEDVMKEIEEEAGKGIVAGQISPFDG